MKNKKWAVWLIAVLLVVLTATGYFAIGAEYGSQDDPLVTLSYINDVLSPNTMKNIDSIFAQKQQELTAQIDQKMGNLDAQIDDKISQLQKQYVQTGIGDDVIQAAANLVIDKLNGSLGPGEGAQWKVIKLVKGKVLTGKVGCELLLRFGSSVCVASGSPGLIDLSNGCDLANGGILEANHLYLITVDGRGIKATSDATLLVCGNYTVS